MSGATTETVDLETRQQAGDVPRPVVALVGNPNTGKTTLFNALTGLRQHTGNYPGVTVEKTVGVMRLDDGPMPAVELHDLPGTYSLAARSPDEIVVADVLLGQQRGSRLPDAVLVVVDAANLERNLFLVTQVIECGRPVVVALNMIDLAESRGVQIDAPALGEQLGCAVVPIVASKRRGLAELKAAVAAAVGDAVPREPAPIPLPEPVEAAIRSLQSFFSRRMEQLTRPVHRVEAMRVLIDRGGQAERRMLDIFGAELAEQLATLRASLASADVQLVVVEPETRYGRIGLIAERCIRRDDAEPRVTLSDRLDALLIHPASGSLIFLLLMAVVFQSIFVWARPLMDLIGVGQSALGGWIAGWPWLGEGAIKSLLVDGVIAGVGAVVVFVPQIVILFGFIAVLEDCGYMSRAAFLMDRLLSRCGLSGRSFVPMLSSFACAVPGIMAARVIENRRDRLTTILVAPLMSCSARLPVYVLLIGAIVVPQDRHWLGGTVSLAGLTLLAMYLLGIVVAVPVAWLLKRTLLRGPTPPFVMEMPTFKWPSLRVVGFRMYDRGKAFLVRAGTIIFAVTIVVWGLLYYPHPASIAAKYDQQKEAAAQTLAGDALADEQTRLDHEMQGDYLRQSALGRTGRFIAPAVAPLGWDWKIASAALASFPAREIVVSTMGVIYNLGSDTDEHSPELGATMKAQVHAEGSLAGQKVYTPLVAVGIMVFFALCAQCASTLAIIKRETASWRWPAFTFVYMTVLAYLATLAVYQGGRLLGLG
ncbi:MAG: Fe(2+) transporter FeoB [Phycisphaerae bacterium]|nr:Fe(2+) transporter FeoB [Phycisphaerae bacterium]